jgi:LmbE family N-acetylglucosaminyl deacetylase
MIRGLRKFFGETKKEQGVYEEAFRFETSLPEASKVLVLAAHPDDETLGCGGTIALHKKSGAEVRVIVFTDGGGVWYQGDGDVREVRKDEAAQAGSILGIDHLYFQGLPDSSLRRHMSGARTALNEIVDSYKPDIVYAPSPMDFHPDHRAVFEMALALLSRGMNVVFYEIYAPVRFNLLVDITEVMPLKSEAIFTYKTSLLGKQGHFLSALKGLNAYRKFLTPVSEDEKYYEAFWLVNVPVSRKEIIKWLTYGL